MQTELSITSDNPFEYFQYFPDFLGQHLANDFYHELSANLDWKQKSIRVYGRYTLEPRLTAWYGDPGTDYAYSGMKNNPLPWEHSLLTIKESLEQKTAYHFNSVLANFYRDGNDAMGWHADDEPELGQGPVIASISLGAPRKFSYKTREKGAKARHLVLKSGSLLLMMPEFQTKYLHAVPKQLSIKSGRINLTFRNIIKEPMIQSN